MWIKNSLVCTNKYYLPKNNTMNLYCAFTCTKPFTSHWSNKSIDSVQNDSYNYALYMIFFILPVELRWHKMKWILIQNELHLTDSSKNIINVFNDLRWNPLSMDFKKINYAFSIWWFRLNSLYIQKEFFWLSFLYFVSFNSCSFCFQYKYIYFLFYILVIGWYIFKLYLLENDICSLF